MSSKSIAISVTGLGKKYTIAHNSTRPTTLREAVVERLRHPFGNGRTEHESFWALRDVNFEIRQGEVVGFIGRNGAGKSTLLKLLSRITGPTTGTIDIHGRIASLLEVGTGFHPELTGRENVYLNGAVLGMSHREIASKFDEIVAFAEVEQFLDTPVKRYSSGMYVRLAFAVAAHLEPEIMIVDEVLSVGDASFQKKCMGKMKDFSGHGRTILFVSHNMNAVNRLCQRAVLMEHGKVIADGPASQVTSSYLQIDQGTVACREWPDLSQAPGNEVVRLRAARARSDDGQASGSCDIRRPIALEMEFEVMKSGYVLIPNFAVYNEEGTLLFITHDTDPTWIRKQRACGRYSSTAWIPGNLLAEGINAVDVAVSRHAPVEVLAHSQSAFAFQVVDSLEGDSARGDYGAHLPGMFRPLLSWTTDFVPRDAQTPLTADLSVPLMTNSSVENKR
jgi:lipopolysaccharide transport system ATP-binding protein